MKNIDFLPRRYREQNSLYKGQILRVAVLALFGAGIGAVALWQYSCRQAVRRQLAAVAGPHLAAQAKTDQLAQVQQQLQEAQAATQLYAYLHHPWPRTQILAAVAEKLPASLTLAEVRISRDAAQDEPGDPRRARSAPPRDPAEEAAEAERHPAVRDLARLRDENDSQRTIVELSGLTHDLASLHAYVAELSDVSLFTKCELASLEAVASARLPGQSRFKLRIVVRPGYGQPGSHALRQEAVAVITGAPDEEETQ